MKNIIVQNPTKYEISYKDSDGKRSKRKLVVIDQTKNNITGYCYKSHGIRTFKKKNISTITSVY